MIKRNDLAARAAKRLESYMTDAFAEVRRRLLEEMPDDERAALLATPGNEPSPEDIASYLAALFKGGK